MDTTARDAVYRFEGFLFDVARGLLLHDNGAEVQLRHKSFELLRLFVENVGCVLDHDRINQTIWPDVIVNDNGITQCVRDIRRALHDDAQTIVRTVPRRGYMFTPTVTAIGGQPGSRSTADAPPLPDGPSLVVMPFKNASNDPEQEYFADGMVEDITTGLSRIRSLFVISRSSAFTYKNHAVDVRQVGRELGVRYVLEGSVRKAGSRIRITGQLIDASTGAHLWADRFDGSLEDVFELQDQVTASVLAAIEPNLRAAEIERARRKPAENLQAYDLMLRALSRKYAYTREGLEEAGRLLRKAIEIDATYAPALANLAGCQWAAVSQNYMDRTHSELVDMVRLAQTALELDSDDPEVLSQAGMVSALPGGDLSGGIALINKAIALNPNNAVAIRLAGLLNAFSGDKQSAITNLERSFRLNPVSQHPAFYFGYALAHFVAAEHETVVEWTAKALQARPNFTPALRYRAASLGLLGRLDEGRYTVRRLLDLVPEFTITRARRHIEFDMNNPFKTPGVADSLYIGLRRSGVPE